MLPVRIGTWNLAGRWSDDHHAFVNALRCDVLLLTEVSDRVDLPGMIGHVGELQIARRRYWAGIWSRHPMTPLPDPHGASAMAEILGYRFYSSILPWRSCSSREPWLGSNTAERTINAVDAIREAAPDIWGGDWKPRPARAGVRRLQGRARTPSQVARGAGPEHRDE